ncbi:hypothetical protein [Nocardia sp. NPDC004260]
MCGTVSTASDSPHWYRREILDMLRRVTVLKAPKGRRSSGAYFSPEFVRLEWMTPTAAGHSAGARFTTD